MAVWCVTSRGSDLSVVNWPGDMPTLANLRGHYSDRCAVVLGSGPSLRLLKDRALVEHKVGHITMRLPNTSIPGPLHKLVVIAVNDAILKVPDADFYFTSDIGMCQYHHWDLLCEHLSVPIVVNSPAFRRHTMRDIFGVPSERVVLYEKRPGKDGVVLSRQDHKIIYGPSSGHCAVHFAYMLGCKRIYLFGFDGRCVGGLKYFWQFRDQSGPGGTRSGHASHNLSALAAQGRKPTPMIYEDFDARTGAPSAPTRNGWLHLSRANPGLPIFDASGGCAGDAFQTVSIEKMLECRT